MTEGWENNEFINVAFDNVNPTPNKTFEEEDHFYSDCDDNRMVGGYLIMTGGTIKKNLLNIPPHFRVRFKCKMWAVDISGNPPQDIKV